jgi:light-regulated signal transduction histidine kinase (bacteriophytochrome)
MTQHGAEGSVDLSTCAREPIHIPGLIQPHGVLLALDPTSFAIEQVSQNVESLLGTLPQDLIGTSPAGLLGYGQFQLLRDRIVAPASEPVIFNVAAGPQHEPMECTASRHEGSVIVELQPLTGAHSLDDLDISLSLQAPLARMERSSDVADLACVVAQEIRTISGFDRVMVYRFDEDWHGEVLAENVSDRYPVAYLGLHFPASDIPAQARELYLLNTLRLIPDTGYVPVPLVPPENPRLHAPLDLSRSDLRSVSPIHLEYLRNIDVRATLTISIIVRGKLWGLVACHHHTPRRLTHAVRSTCNFFAQMLALKLTARIEQTNLSQQLDASEKIVKFVAELESTQSLWEALRRNWPELLRIFSADALLVRGPEGVVVYGTPLSGEDLLPSLARLEEAAEDGIASSSALSTLDDRARSFASEVSGALYVGLSRKDDSCLAILRREESASVKWAGDPNKPAIAGASKGRLSPRASFAVWEEIKHRESRRWSAADRAKATILHDQVIAWQQARDEVRLLTHYDPLTELPNRRLLDELLKRSLSEADEQSKLVGVLFIDIDRFKRFNDRLGHATGDRVLRWVAGRISRAVRDCDIVSRLG